MIEELKKSYWSVIPADVRYCKEVADGAKLLYSEITALCNEKGFCWAGNDYFAELYGVDKRTISRWITALANKDFIYIDLTGARRKIFLAHKFNPAEVSPEEAPSEPIAPTSVQKKKKVNTPKKEVKPKYNNDDLFLAELLLSKVIYNFPHFENKKIKISEWADDIRKLREIEKATKDQIQFMITWVHGGEILQDGKPPRVFAPHDFWAKNIMSAGKLRKQWIENLVPQLQEWAKKTHKKSTVTQL